MPPKEPDVRGPHWRKATLSQANGACVEVASLGGEIAVRNSKEPDGHILVFGMDQWNEFLRRIKAGEFDPSASG